MSSVPGSSVIARSLVPAGLCQVIQPCKLELGMDSFTLLSTSSVRPLTPPLSAGLGLRLCPGLTRQLLSECAIIFTTATTTTAKEKTSCWIGGQPSSVYCSKDSAPKTWTMLAAGCLWGFCESRGKGSGQHCGSHFLPTEKASSDPQTWLSSLSLGPCSPSYLASCVSG